MPYIRSVASVPFPIGPLAFDRPDSRDWLYDYRDESLPEKFFFFEYCTSVKNQGREGSCVGFGAVSCYEAWMLMRRSPAFIRWLRLEPEPDMSERWAYESAKKNDRWPGEDYEGSSIKGGMIGLSKGLCEECFWPYVAGEKGKPLPGAEENAAKHKISEYRKVISRYEEADTSRVMVDGDELDLDPLTDDQLKMIKEALFKNGPLSAGTIVHTGWGNVAADGIIPYSPFNKKWGGHAIALVGYDDEAELFWLKNSWSEEWGKQGYGALHYEDVAKNMMSVWIGKI